mgnify:CR=1 FL=1
MNNNVLIKISGLQMVDDTGDNVESMSAGKYYLKKGKHYILYEDMKSQEKVL